MQEAIRGFKQAGYEWLSNMQFCPNGVRVGDYETWTSEHMYVLFKTLKEDERQLFVKDGKYGKNPYEAKKKGGTKAGIITLRPDWEKVQFEVMHSVVYAKFTQNKELGDKLLATGDAYLEEANTWGDNRWGTVNGVGENWLGKILMQVRDELIAGYPILPKTIYDEIADLESAAWERKYGAPEK